MEHIKNICRAPRPLCGGFWRRTAKGDQSTRKVDCDGKYANTRIYGSQIAPHYFMDQGGQKGLRRFPERGDAYRLVYALQLGEDIWVVHAFQKKATKGIATPKHEIDLVRDRIKRLKEMLGD